MHYLKKYFLSLPVLLLFLFVSCVDDNLKEPTPGNDLPLFQDCYYLSFTASLCDMGGGGTRATGDPESVTKWENYIDPEKFRVLFFDNKDKFLFESKNRSVKELGNVDRSTKWLVTVPLGTFGNDTYFADGKDYDWVAIKNHLTTQSFKIAILANRPTYLEYPGNFSDSELSLPDGVFANDGPNWGPSDVGKRDIFELHHCQYDIIYADKGNHKNGADESYYDFVMGDIKTDRPTMGSAVSWVSFANNDTDKETLLSSSVAMRNLQMPSKEHPIPMYGIQLFGNIPPQLWKKGQPFDMSNVPTDLVTPDYPGYTYQTVSLLRSCVRLDIKIPKTAVSKKPILMSLWYSNIYSRCEPMDVWTPTDQLWGESHGLSGHDNCEMQSLINYGPVSNTNSQTTTKADYQKRMSWFYGVWNKDKDWQFWTRKDTKATLVAENTNNSNTPYPRIFNTCIQRNKAIRCNNGDFTDAYNDGYYHWIVYTGERNPNDPNTLPIMGKNPYIACFIFSLDNTKFYCVPLLQYGKNKDNDASNLFGPHDNTKLAGGNWPAAMDTYMNSLYNKTGDNIPYPLLRNHIYEFTLTGTRSSDGTELENLMVTSEVIYNPNL